LSCRWLLLAKLQQQSGNAEGFTSAQGQALELQRTLIEQLRQSGGAGAGGSGSSSTKGKASQGVADLLTGLGGGMAAAVGNLTSAKAKAASICFDLAEYHRKHRQFDKVSTAHAASVTVLVCVQWKQWSVSQCSRVGCTVVLPWWLMAHGLMAVCCLFRRLRRHTRLV
jgi:hypothetical protein